MEACGTSEPAQFIAVANFCVAVAVRSVERLLEESFSLESELLSKTLTGGLSDLRLSGRGQEGSESVISNIIWLPSWLYYNEILARLPTVLDVVVVVVIVSSVGFELLAVPDYDYISVRASIPTATRIHSGVVEVDSEVTLIGSVKSERERVSEVELIIPNL